MFKKGYMLVNKKTSRKIRCDRQFHNICADSWELTPLLFPFLQLLDSGSLTSSFSNYAMILYWILSRSAKFAKEAQLAASKFWDISWIWRYMSSNSSLLVLLISISFAMANLFSESCFFVYSNVIKLTYMMPAASTDGSFFVKVKSCVHILAKETVIFSMRYYSIFNSPFTT